MLDSPGLLGETAGSCGETLLKGDRGLDVGWGHVVPPRYLLGVLPIREVGRGQDIRLDANGLNDRLAQGDGGVEHDASGPGEIGLWVQAVTVAGW